ncbi:hypothetical protein PanWU01x14_204070 [Parasponia andersonii]|uniref:Uncharacterized protein n=1 Tax=Parasponia andersonii TaxID=3476 RepID=A0A2P5BWK7_PARAD|nr:hypothetical protein PanWU01x14_204070 [Parasponia andersonii]
MCWLITRATRLENTHNAPIVVQARKNGIIRKNFKFTIQPHRHVVVYYSDLRVEYNYSMTYVNAFPVGQEDQGTDVDTSDLRDNEVIVFGFENEMVTANPIKGNRLARLGLFKWFVSPTPIPDQQGRDVGGIEDVV